MTVVTISQCVSNHRMGHLQYIQFLFVDYTSVKPEKGIRIKKETKKTPNKQKNKIKQKRRHQYPRF